MLNWPWFKKPVTISRNELRSLISRQCGDQDFVPLDMTYRLVPNHKWLIGKTPIFSRYHRDCNKRAHKTVNKMLDYCVGMCLIPTSDPLIDHCVLIVCMEDKRIMLYDPSLRTLKSAKLFKIKRMWL